MPRGKATSGSAQPRKPRQTTRKAEGQQAKDKESTTPEPGDMVTISKQELRSLIEDVVKSQSQPTSDSHASASMTTAAETVIIDKSVQSPQGQGEQSEEFIPPVALASTMLTLDVLVEPDLAKDIALGKYIELSKLIPERLMPNFRQADIRQRSFTPRISRFNDWLAAFTRYATVYLKAFPQEAAEILKYIDDIRSYSERGVNWVRYDEVFRKARAGGRLSWGQFMSEIYNMAAPAPFTGRNYGDAGRGPTDTQNSRTAQPICRYFNGAGGCRLRVCTYKHACRVCKGNHAAVSCKSNVGRQ